MSAILVLELYLPLWRGVTAVLAHRRTGSDIFRITSVTSYACSAPTKYSSETSDTVRRRQAIDSRELYTCAHLYTSRMLSIRLYKTMNFFSLLTFHPVFFLALLQLRDLQYRIRMHRQETPALCIGGQASPSGV